MNKTFIYTWAGYAAIMLLIIAGVLTSGCGTVSSGRGGVAALPFEKGDLAELMVNIPDGMGLIMKASANSVPQGSVSSTNLDAPMTKGEYLLSQAGRGGDYADILGEYLQKPTQGEVVLIVAASEDVGQVAAGLSGLAWAEPGERLEEKIFHFYPDNDAPVEGTEDPAPVPEGEDVPAVADSGEAQYAVVGDEHRFYFPTCRTWKGYRLRDPDGPRNQRDFLLDGDRQYVVMRDGGQIVNAYPTESEEGTAGIIVFDVRGGPGVYRPVVEQTLGVCP